MKPIDLTGWLQEISEKTQELHNAICDGSIPDHYDYVRSATDISNACKDLYELCERYRRDCLETPQQRRDDARADAYSKRSSDT